MTAGEDGPATARRDQHTHDWDDLARLDPYWAVLSHRDKKHGRWDPAEFFASGETDVIGLLETGAGHGRPRDHERALELGCGLGRLAPALARRFGAYHGLDISTEMVQRARALHTDTPNTTFSVVDDPRLAGIADASYDLVVSMFVLQHVHSTTAVMDSLGALARVVRPGGLLAVQLPASIPLPTRAAHRLRRSAYRALRAAGVAGDVPYRRMGLVPMIMRALPEDRVVSVLEAAGARILTIERGTISRLTPNRVYYATRDEAPAGGA